MNSIIKVENFTKSYGDFIAVNNISFEVEEGTVFAFLGPNEPVRVQRSIRYVQYLRKPQASYSLMGKMLRPTRVRFGQRSESYFRIRH
jgi:ABC-type uncharacterized transport system ATPase subunit